MKKIICRFAIAFAMLSLLLCSCTEKEKTYTFICQYYGYIEDDTAAEQLVEYLDNACEGYFSKTVTVNVNDYETVTKNIALIPKDWALTENHNPTLVYPNPTKGCFTIEGDVSYQLFNSLGQLVLSGVCKGKSQIDVQGLNQGVYFLQLKSGSGIRVEKLVIEK